MAENTFNTPEALVIDQTIDINPNGNSCQIRADLEIDAYRCIRVWGRVCDDETHRPMEGVLLALVEVECAHGREYYKGIAHAATDTNGIYQFDLCGNCRHKQYKIFVNTPRVCGGLFDQADFPACPVLPRESDFALEQTQNP